jgi:uncharacterized protein YndB with AHSA1/START domain
MTGDPPPAGPSLKSRSATLGLMPQQFVASQAYYVAAAPSRVFKFLVEPRLLVKWFLTDAQVSPQTGGPFSFDWMGGYHMDGRLIRYEAGKSVSFLWTDRLPSGGTAETKAAFRVAKKGRGTLLTLRHSGFKNPTHFAECSSRWA